MSLRVTLLGTGVGIPQPGRSQASVLVESRTALLFDCGAGTLLRLDDAGMVMEDMDAVFLTHLHLDHVSDVLALAKARYLLQLPGLKVYGPMGTENWLQVLQGAFPYLEKTQIEVHEVKPMQDIRVKEYDIFAEEARHSVTALAYRIESEEKVVVYSGDTEPSARIAALAEGADLLVHECSFPEPFEVTNHSTPKKLGRVLKNVKRVVLTHLYPEAQGHEDEMAQQVAEISGTPTETGWDLMQVLV